MTNLPSTTGPLSQLRRRLPVLEQPTWILLALAAVIALLVAGAQASDIVLYNHSPSIPVGLYARTQAPIERGAIVTVRAADVAGHYAYDRGFADEGDRFIKRVAAAVGHEVCAEGDVLTIDGVVAAYRQDRDSAGSTLPRWFGCRSLSGDEFLLLGDTADSFDGRYWGVVRRSQIEGVWRPLFVNSAQGG